jgi:hypothetical protein
MAAVVVAMAGTIYIHIHIYLLGYPPSLQLHLQPLHTLECVVISPAVRRRLDEVDVPVCVVVLLEWDGCE